MLFEYYTLHRINALFIKEFRQMMRDKIILISIIIYPLIQLILIATIFNVNPHHLSLAVVTAEDNIFVRQLVQAFKNTDYFAITHYTNEKNAEYLLKSGKVQFILNFPPNFATDLVRGKKPSVLLTSDSSNPLTVTAALGSVANLNNNAYNNELTGTLAPLQTTSPAFNIDIHQRYNPESIALYFSIPNMLCMILSITLVSLTTNLLVKEMREGTMESLLTSPATPGEIIFAKVTPYLFFGYLQAGFVLLMGIFIFQIPFQGSILLFMIISFPVILTSLLLGIFFSSIGKTEFSAFQYTTYYSALSILFSGMFFPFAGMPTWAQWIGTTLPQTHFARIAVGIALKGNKFEEIWPDLWPILLFLTIVIILSISRFKKTLD